MTFSHKYVPWHLTRQFACPSISAVDGPCTRSTDLPLNVDTNLHGVMPHSWPRLLLSLRLSFVSPTSIDPCHQLQFHDALWVCTCVCCAVIDSVGFLSLLLPDSHCVILHAWSFLVYGNSIKETPKLSWYNCKNIYVTCINSNKIYFPKQKKTICRRGILLFLRNH